MAACELLVVNLSRKYFKKYSAKAPTAELAKLDTKDRVGNDALKALGRQSGICHRSTDILSPQSFYALGFQQLFQSFADNTQSLESET